MGGCAEALLRLGRCSEAGKSVLTQVTRDSARWHWPPHADLKLIVRAALVLANDPLPLLALLEVSPSGGAAEIVWDLTPAQANYLLEERSKPGLARMIRDWLTEIAWIRKQDGMAAPIAELLELRAHETHGVLEAFFPSALPNPALNPEDLLDLAQNLYLERHPFCDTPEPRDE